MSRMANSTSFEQSEGKDPVVDSEISLLVGAAEPRPSRISSQKRHQLLQKFWLEIRPSSHGASCKKTSYSSHPVDRKMGLCVQEVTWRGSNPSMDWQGFFSSRDV